MKKIYLFETRKLDFLKSYMDKVAGMGFEPVVLAADTLHGDKRFEAFKKAYVHLSPNSQAFEVNCFARYFAIARVHDSNDSFILSDSDIYVTGRLRELTSSSFGRDVFIGSEGFYEGGAEGQISPHFSIWNKALMEDFVAFVNAAYERDREEHFLAALREEQEMKLGVGAISDMTLLQMWVRQNKIPFINSNGSGDEFGIDHNISALFGADGPFKESLGRKAIALSGKDRLCCFLKSGKKMDMSVLHFQGGYKRILNDFYLGNQAKFLLFSMYINLGRKVNKMIR